MLHILNPICPFRPCTIRSAQFHAVVTMHGMLYDTVVANVSRLCDSQGWSNTSPKRVVDRLINSGHIEFKP